MCQLNALRLLNIKQDGTVRSNIPPANRRALSHTVLRSANTGPTKKTLGLSIVHTFKLLLSGEICDIIICETNRRGAQSYQKWNTENPTRIRVWKPVTPSEFDAYLGIILFAGVSRSSREHTEDLWKCSAHPLYRATMGLQRFYTILRYIRFDNGNTREQRLLTDKAAAILDNWLMLNRNLKEFCGWAKRHRRRTVISLSWWYSLYTIHSIQTCKVWNQDVVGM